MSDFLKPNKLIRYTSGTRCVSLIREIEDRADVYKANYCKKFIYEYLSYDHLKAIRFKFLSFSFALAPDLDTVLTARKGCCLDYACMLCAMLRSLKVPCKVVFGTCGKKRHAWNEILVRGEWVRADVVADQQGWKGTEYTKKKEY